MGGVNGRCQKRNRYHTHTHNIMRGVHERYV